MTKFIYVVEVRGLVPAHLSRKVIEAHARALKSKDFPHPRHGKDVAKSKAVLESGENRLQR